MEEYKEREITEQEQTEVTGGMGEAALKAFLAVKERARGLIADIPVTMKLGSLDNIDKDSDKGSDL